MDIESCDTIAKLIILTAIGIEFVVQDAWRGARSVIAVIFDRQSVTRDAT